MATGTYHDARRISAATQDSLEELKARHANKDRAIIDGDEAEYAERFELDGTELLDEEPIVALIPMQANEFRCNKCYLVRHYSQRDQPNRNLCHDCA